jgi:hypothetical protein
MMRDITKGVVITVVSTLLLGGITFLLEGYIFPFKDLTGEWEITTVVKTTSFNNYKDMELCHIVHLLQKDNSITGSGEKIREKLSNGDAKEYIGKERTKLRITGHYKKRFFDEDEIILNVIEEGERRESRTTYSLTIKSDDFIVGNFSSTAANSKGDVFMTKK